MTQNSPRFSPPVETALRTAGWYPGRAVTDEQMAEWMIQNWKYEEKHIFQVRMFSAAWHILREFGGLTLRQDAPGETCYREDIVFTPIYGSQFKDFHVGVEKWYMCEWAVKSPLFPIGYIKESPVTELGVDIYGRIHSPDYDTIYGQTVEEALENLIIGRRPKEFEEEQTEGGGYESVYMLPMLRERFAR